jgi:hypothetical protein
MSPATRRPWRYRGRRREGVLRDWPVGFAPMTDPWAGAPLFSTEYERIRRHVAVGQRG